MTAADFERLALYRNKRGPLNPMLRMESGFALVAACVLNAAGSKKQGGKPFVQADFMPWADDKEDDLSVESVFKKLGGRAHG